MQTFQSYIFLRKQIPLMIALSLVPGLGYIYLASLNGVIGPSLFWYALNVLASIWGYFLYANYHPKKMNSDESRRWFSQLSAFFLLLFSLWTLIFILYADEARGHLNYIAIFTQIGSAVVASTLLFSHKHLVTSTLLILLLPLSIFFALIGALYGYVLSIFALVLLGVLLYAAYSSRRLLEKSYRQASHDHLTGLKNRRFFISHLKQKVKNITHSKNYAYMMLIDLDHFKTINDSLGHDIGDKLLKIVSSRLQEQIKKNQLLARLGGDEFVIVSQDFKTKEKALDAAQELSTTLLMILKQTFVIDIHHLYISASIGVEIIDESMDDANRLIKEADIAMYEVKAQGRDGVILFNDELSQRIESHLQIERHLHSALKNGEISLVYQPQLNESQKVVGCEVLARWHNETLGYVRPDKFIAIAEHTGLIVELGNYILETSFATLERWHQKGIHLKQYSINISVRQLFHSNFIQEVIDLTEKYNISKISTKVIFEITETVLVEDIQRVVTIINILENLNINFSMDDFGTGYSSLSYLKAMPISELKIDQSFVSHLEENQSDQAMIITIINMAKIFNLTVVAEGVETESQRLFLQENHCHVFQGYYFSKPLIQADFEHYYEKNSVA